MASILGDTKYYQPAPRFGHCAAPIGDRLYMWGGLTEDFSESSRRKLPSVVEIYDPYLEAWQQEATTGVPPPAFYGGGCTSVHESLLWYGGLDDKSCFGTLHQLNTVTLKWEELHQSTPQGPMDKVGCGLVSFQGEKVGLFGGYGIPTGLTQPGSTFTKDTIYSHGGGWTNEFHLFDLREGVWSSPPTTGSRPPPCSYFTFTAIDSHRGILFGGRTEHGWTNDVYIINAQTMHWTKLDKSGGGPWPAVRSLHAACCLNYGEEHPQQLVSGGVDEHGNTLSDLWVLDVEEGTWKELILPEGAQPRRGHSATAFKLSPGIVEVTMFGGCPKFVPGGDPQQQPKISDTTVVRLESLASGGAEWAVEGVAKDEQLGSPERIREKIQVKTAMVVSSELAGERENVRKAESKITELEKMVESAETRVRIALARAVSAEIQCDRIPHLVQKLQFTQELLHSKEEELKTLSTQFRATHEVVHTQEQFSAQQRDLSHLQYTAQQREEQLQAKVQSTQQLLQNKKEELIALTIQCRTTHDTLLHTQKQLQARVQENAALHTHNQTLESQVETLQNEIAQLERTMQATQVALGHIPLSKEHSLAEVAQISVQPKTVSVCQAGVQTGAVGTLHSAELQMQHAELQQRVTDLEEELAKEAFLETALGYEVDAFREDVMGRQQIQFHDISTQTVVDGNCIPGTSPTGFLRGAEVVAERDFVITNQARSYCWDEYGFRLHVPKESLDVGLSETAINVRVSLSGYFQLPADSELVSAVYWVFSPHMFSQPLTVEVQHCASPSQCSNLSFVRTRCTQKRLPYQFNELEGGVFSRSFYGSISVNHFSGLGIAKRKRPRSESSESDSGTDEEQYCASLYKQKKGKGQYRLHFVVTKDLKAHRTVVKEELSNLDTVKDLSLHFMDYKDQISIMVPRDGTILESGWKLKPLYDPVIKKWRVDHFSSGQHLPECELSLRLLPDKPLTSFEHDIELQGTADHHYFTLCIEDTDIFSGSESAKQSGGNTLQTFDSSTELFVNKYQDGVQSAPELSDLMNIGAKIPHKWQEVGIQLGVEYDQLKFLSVSSPPGSQQFASVFTAWKNCMKKSYTWVVLIQALQTPAVNEPRLAQELSSKFTM